MSRRVDPPAFTGDIAAWAEGMRRFLIERDEVEAVNQPAPMQLVHQVQPRRQSAAQDGILMYDPARQTPVYSEGGQWLTFSSVGTYNYLATDTGGSVVDDINNTDFTGQDGAVGACAQCPVNAETSFYHAGVQYRYAGPTPASYGAGCADTMDPDWLIPTGVGDHGALNGLADDDHPQYHTDGRGDARYYRQSEVDALLATKTRWRGVWAAGSYLKNDMVTGDGEWLTIANKDTSDVAPPRPSGDPVYDLPVAAFTTQQFTGVVQSGREWDAQVPVQISQVQVWVPVLSGTTNYQFYVYTHPVGQPEQVEFRAISEPILQEGGWSTLAQNNFIVPAGTTLGVVIDALDSGPSSLVTGGWTRAANINTGDPGNAAWGTQNNASTLRINYIDLDSNDRTSELQGIIPGSSVVFANTANPAQSMAWTINGLGVDQGTHIRFDNVTYDGAGSSGEPPVGETTTMTATVPTPSPTDYSEQVGGNLSANTRGILRLNGADQPGAENNAYGVRIKADEYVVSPDWDIMGYVGLG